MIDSSLDNIKRTALGVILGIGITLTAAIPVSANSKIEELNQKIADISLLNQQLNERSDQVAAIRKALQNQKNGLTAEISILAKSLNIKTYPEAVKQLRIRYNLELLRAITAYLDELDIKSLFYQNGRNKLAYLQQLARDDVKMISTINDLKIEALVTQISLVINAYLPEAHVIQINIDHIIQPSAKTIWQGIAAKN